MFLLDYIFGFILQSTLIAIVVSTIAFAVYVFYKKQKSETYEKRFIVFCFVFYMTTLLYLTVYREGLFTNTSRTLNLYPFVTLISSFQLLYAQDALAAIGYVIYNVIGNILWFMPLGYFLCIFHKNIKIYYVFWGSLLFSLTIEVVQYLCYVGISDIDDVIFNTLGGLTGYVVYILVKRGNRHEYKKTSA
ncbi:MAG: VanZ family protein [Breznakia sp.]